MRQRRDDVDGEADEQRADGGVDGPEEGEDDGQEPDGHHDGQPRQRALEDALGVVHPDHLLPHEVERRAREPERDELVDQHQDHRRVAPPGLGQQREGVRVGQQLVAERPVHGRSRRQRQREHVQRRQQVDVLELGGLPHRVHDLPVKHNQTRSISLFSFVRQKFRYLHSVKLLFICVCIEKQILVGEIITDKTALHMRVNDAATLVVDEMIRDDGKRKTGAASASPSHAPAQQG